MISLPRDDIEIAKIVASCEYVECDGDPLGTQCAKAGLTRREIQRVLSLMRRNRDEEAYALAYELAEARGVTIEDDF